MSTRSDERSMECPGCGNDFVWSYELGLRGQQCECGHVFGLFKAIEEVAAFEDGRTARRMAAVKRRQRWAQSRQVEADGRFDTAHRMGEMIPMGQPILVGHHSEKRHRRDLARIDGHIEHGLEARNMANRHTHRAESIERELEHRQSGMGIERRLGELRAALRDVQRKLDGTSRSGRDHGVPMTGREAERLSAMELSLECEIAYWEGRLAKLTESGAHKVWESSDFQPGDLVNKRGTWYVVIRVNRTTLTVHVPVLCYGATLPVRYTDVQGRREGNEKSRELVASLKKRKTA